MGFGSRRRWSRVCCGRTVCAHGGGMRPAPPCACHGSVLATQRIRGRQLWHSLTWRVPAFFTWGGRPSAGVALLGQTGRTDVRVGESRLLQIALAPTAVSCTHDVWRFDTFTSHMCTAQSDNGGRNSMHSSGTVQLQKHLVGSLTLTRCGLRPACLPDCVAAAPTTAGS